MERSFSDGNCEVKFLDLTLSVANPVCDAPFHWLQIDHIEPDSLGGETALNNARPLSGADNGWRSNNTNRGKWPMPERAPVGDLATTVTAAANQPISDRGG